VQQKKQMIGDIFNWLPQPPTLNLLSHFYHYFEFENEKIQFVDENVFHRWKKKLKKRNFG